MEPFQHVKITKGWRSTAIIPFSRKKQKGECKPIVVGTYIRAAAIEITYFQFVFTVFHICGLSWPDICQRGKFLAYVEQQRKL